ncbi:MAG: hypothetical protein KGK11_08780 [Sphingomonadales bacterium]|nr:hypothetical protein [Sphingomonadales bacterium]
MIRGCSVLLAVALLAGCTTAPDDDLFQLPLGDAFMRLQMADLAGFKAVESCGAPLSIATDPIAPDRIRWRLASGISDVATVTVQLTAEGDDATRVAIDIPPTAQQQPFVVRGIALPRPVVQQPLRPAVQELVAAALQQRPFDPSHLPQGGDDACAQQRASSADASPPAQGAVPAQNSPPSPAAAVIGQPDSSAFAPTPPQPVTQGGTDPAAPSPPQPAVTFDAGSGGAGDPAAAGNEGGN